MELIELKGRTYGEQLPNCHNFRDMGGVEIASGINTRHGLLFRSGRLSHVSKQELNFLQELGIRRIIDLRSLDEAAAHPDRLPGDVLYVQHPMDEGSLTLESVIALFRSAAQGKADPDLHIRGSYRSMPEQYGSHFRQMFSMLLAADYMPTLVHCTGGKDRTGLFSALFLLALGAREEAVFADYLMSGFDGERLAAASQRYARQFRKYDIVLDPILTYPLLTTRPEFLRAAIDAVRDSYGSIDRYLFEVIGLGEGELQYLRERFLGAAC
jgi:protein-tyrosine phosphatase